MLHGSHSTLSNHELDMSPVENGLEIRRVKLKHNYDVKCKNKVGRGDRSHLVLYSKIILGNNFSTSVFLKWLQWGKRQIDPHRKKEQYTCINAKFNSK